MNNIDDGSGEESGNVTTIMTATMANGLANSERTDSDFVSIRSTSGMVKKISTPHLT